MSGGRTSMRKVALAGGGVVKIVEVDVPTPQPDEVLIRTAVSAVCGSELGAYRGSGHNMGQGNPGHEAAGEVVAVGSAVLDEGGAGPRPGDRVGISGVVGCGACEQCSAGRYTWCTNFRGSADVHAEYFTHPARGCHVLPDDVDWDVGALVTGDGLGVPFHTTTRLAERPYDTVAVFGLGPIGLATVLVQSFLGRRVVGIDISEPRLRLAEKMGAVATIRPDADADLPAAVCSALGGVAPEVCVEAAGSPVTAHGCFATVRTGGRVVFNGEQGPVPLSPSDEFIRRDVSAHGSWFYHFSEYPAMLGLVQDGLDLAQLVTHRVRLADAAEGYLAMADGRSGKVLITYQ